MVHSPNDALQSHKLSGQNSPRGRVSVQKGLKNPENPEKLTVGVRVRVRVRVRVTKLVYQIGLTTFFRSQGRENILAAASSKQQASSKQASN